VPWIHRFGYLAAALAVAALVLLALGWRGARPAPTEAPAREPRDGPS
jgi:hypothetical protein